MKRELWYLSTIGSSNLLTWDKTEQALTRSASCAHKGADLEEGFAPVLA